MRAIVFAVVVVGVVFAGFGMVPGIASADQAVSGGYGTGDVYHWAGDQSSDSHSWRDHDWRHHDMSWWDRHGVHWKWSADNWTLGWTDDAPGTPDSGTGSGASVVPTPSSGGGSGTAGPVSATPEPSSLLLLTSVLPGLAGMGAVVRRRRRSAR